MTNDYTCLTNDVASLKEAEKKLLISVTLETVLTGFLKRLKTEGTVHKYYTLIGKFAPHWIMA